ncbi:MAG: hypothetical protein KA347_12205 [Bacteroidia bacterium]|nr:hypothetical protein [Bacteroidia bacterium]
MKTIFFAFTLAIAAFHFASAQSAQSVYFELGGPGIASFNYDTRFSGREGGLGGRIGVGYSKVVSSGSSLVYLPLGINYLLGKDKKHYFEIGGGVTPVFNSSPEGESAINETFAHLVLGYRFQPINKGFTFRAFICPVYGNGIFVPYYVGISGGYKF